MKEVVDKLKKLNKTVATMESCTGGFVASSITDVEGASDVLKFSAITYSNDYKVKMGVSKKVIDKYSVYSHEVARQMAYNISLFSSSDYGIGITGKINRIDKNNLSGDDNQVFYCIYDKDNNIYYDFSLRCISDTRHENKEYIVNDIKGNFINIMEAVYEYKKSKNIF